MSKKQIHKSDKNHVYDIPDTYIGSAKKNNIKELILIEHENKYKLVEKTMDTPNGVKRLFLEILSNAADNCDASRRSNPPVKPGKIEIVMNNNEISIKNYGLHISLKKKKIIKEGEDTILIDSNSDEDNIIYEPEYIFGKLRTGSNFNENEIRMGCGRNGYGSKLTNIFSKKFEVIVKDPIENKIFKGIWKDNMFKNDESKKPDCIIEDEVKKISKGSTEIKWILDFERFNIDGYSDLDIALFKRYAVDFSLSCKLIISFNGINLDYRDINDYSTLLWEEEELKKNILKYSWNPMIPSEFKNLKNSELKKKIIKAEESRHIPELEILIIDTPDNGKIISYANGMMTDEGGTHTDKVVDKVYKYIDKDINKNKGKDDKKITKKHIKSHLSFIIVARLPNVQFGGQTKNKLTHPKVDLDFEDKELSKIKQWDIITRLKKEIEAMNFKDLKKDSGKKHVFIEKYQSANKAGTKESSKCKLYLVEGLSASKYPERRLIQMPGGKNYNGLLPLGGKLMNVSKNEDKKYYNNKHLNNIKDALGLKDGIDYSDIKLLKRDLKYGMVIITCDADIDGYHILCLILNFFRLKFPSILKLNMISYLKTPLVKVFKNKKITERFLNEKDFVNWLDKKHNNKLPKGYKAQYFKGLGSSKPSDIEDDINFAETLICFYDDNCRDVFDLAFQGKEKEKTDLRKKWIDAKLNFDNIEYVNLDDFLKSQDCLKDENLKLVKSQKITNILNTKLVEYNRGTFMRSIPSIFDFFKESQRKVLESALRIFNYKPFSKELVSAQFIGMACVETKYHHGSTSLEMAHIKMSQDHTGSNNLGYFHKGGEFGSRSDLGDGAASPRYTRTTLSSWIPYVYEKENIELIQKRKVDDEYAESFWIPGVIPVGIVNGVNGIATGWSTTTASHNPIDVINWFKQKCNNIQPEPIQPWYNGYTGKIILVEKDKDIIYNPFNENDIPKITEHNNTILKNNKGKITMISMGNLNFIDNKNGNMIYEIDELPVGQSFNNYRDFLSKNKSQKINIHNFEDHSTADKPKFIIEWNGKNRPNHKDLKLIKKTGLSNITFIDHHANIKHYSSIQEVMEIYYTNMIEHYDLYNKHRIKIEETYIKNITEKNKFIESVINGDIIIIKGDEDNIFKKMDELKIPHKYYDETKSREFSKQNIEKYKNEINNSKIKIQKYKQMKPQDIWLNKLNILEQKIEEYFKNKK